MDGATATISTKAKSSGNAQVYKIDGSATGIKEIQYSPSTVNSVNQSTHIGEYYKITCGDGSKIKVVDPAAYRPKFYEGKPIYDVNTVCLNPQGQKIMFNPANNAWVPK
jgi:filamentous hemagglutinin